MAMERGVINTLLQQLLSQGPVVVVCLAGFVMAILFIGRGKGPALLAMLGTGILLASTVGFVLLYAILLPMARERGWDAERISRLMVILSIAGGIVRAIGLAALLAAVFAGREPRYPEPA